MPWGPRRWEPDSTVAVQTPMTCSEFIETFSDYIDERGAPAIRAAAARHRDSCEPCRHYEATYLAGRSLLHDSVDSLEVGEDFYPRLRHRLYHVDDERALARSSLGAVSPLMILGAAALLATVLGVPVLFEPEPEVELSPIVVSAPAPRPLGLRLPLPSLLPPSLSPAALELRGEDLWRQSAALFYDYAPVRARSRVTPASRFGVQ